MAFLFISHSSADNAASARLREILRDRGYDALFLDFDPGDGIPAGRSWERELYLNLRRCDAVIFLLSAASAGSRWCFAELALARSVQKPVFGLVVEEGASQPLIEDRQLIQCPNMDDAATLERLWKGLRLAGLEARDAFSLPPDRSPYPGLRPFDTADAAVFFGRDAEIERLLQLLQPSLSRMGGRAVAVVGASGSGKSSLVRAGLIPRLDKLGGTWFALAPLLPGARPLVSLARVLAAALRKAGVKTAWRDLEKEIRSDPEALVDRGHDLAEALEPSPSALLLFVDQLEELVTRAPPGDAAQFLTLLRATVDHPDSPWWLVTTLRADFVTAKAGEALLSDVMDEVVLLAPLNRARFFEVIERPATRAGLELETGLAGRMVEDTRVGDAMPLLAYTLNRLYDRARSDGRWAITAADYEQVGGVTGSLKLQADRVLAELEGHFPRDQVLASLVRFASVDDEDRLVGQALQRSGLDDSTGVILDAFVQARLVKSDGVNQGATLEVAHEALLRRWQPLRDAIDSVRQDLRQRRRIGRAAGEWDRSGRQDASFLVHRGSRLTDAELLLAREGFLDTLARDYLQACLALREQERSERERKDRELADALAMRIWEGARSSGAQSPLLASHLLANAAEVARDPGLRANVLRDQAVYLAGPALIAMFGAELQAPLFAPSGTCLACCEGPLIRLRSADDGGLLGVDFELPDQAAGLCFSPDGRRLLGWTTSGTPLARLWDTVEGRQVGQDLKRHRQFDDVAFTPAGDRLLVVDFDRLSVWRGEDGRRELELGSKGKIQRAAFSADGARLLLTTLSTIRLVALPGGADIFPPLEPGGHLEGAVLSQDGSRLLSWTNGMPYGEGLPFGTVTLWDANTGQELQTIDHSSYRSQAAFFCDAGEHFATSRDGWLTLWRVDGGEIARIDHDAGSLFGGIADAIPTRDGYYLLTVGNGIARFFGSTTGTTVGEPMPHDGCAKGAFDHREQRIATWGRRTVLLRLVSGLPLGPEMLHESNIQSVAFSARGDRLLTRTRDGITRLWRAPPATALTRPLIHDHKGGTNGARFSPDGRYVLAWAWSATLWDCDSGEPVGPSMNYPGMAGLGVGGGTFYAANHRLVTSGDAARVWWVQSAEPVGPVLKHPGGAAGAVFTGSEDGPGEPVIVWGGKSARKWQPVTGEEVDQPLEIPAAATAWALAPDAGLLAAWEGQRLHLLDLGAWQLRSIIIEHRAAVADLRFNSAGDRLLVWGKVGQVALYAVETGRAVIRPEHDSGWKHPASFSGDGTALVAWQAGIVTVRDTASGATRGKPIKVPDYIVAAALDGPGRQVAVWGINELRVFRVESGEQIGPTLDHRGVAGARFTRDGNYLLSWGSDHHARLWSQVSGHQVGPEMRHGASVQSADFNPAQDRILTVELAGFPRIWELGDFRVPAEHLGLRIRVQSGTCFDAANARVRPLDRGAWEKDRDAFRALEGLPPSGGS